jgi:mono/diheme cytochrome c family protein
MFKQSLLPLAIAAFFACAGVAAAQTFPDGPGKEILEKKCSTCHAPEQVTTFGRSAEEWHEVVVNMIDLGAEVNEEEAKVLVEYLAKNWPLKGSTPAAEQPTPSQPPAADHPTDEKDRQGKEILEKKCSTCHAPEQATTFGRSPEEWREVVANMIDLGAELNEQEAKVLIDYLAKNWPLKGSAPAAGQPSAQPPAADQPANEKKEEKPAEKPAEKGAQAALAPVSSHTRQ